MHTRLPFITNAQTNDIQKGIEFLLKHGYTYEEIVNTFPDSDLELIANATSFNENEIVSTTDENGNILNNSTSLLTSNYIVLPDKDVKSTTGGKLQQRVDVFGLDDNTVMLSYSFHWLEIPKNRKKNRPTVTSSHGVGFSFSFAKDTTHADGIKDHQAWDDRGYISCRATIKSSNLCLWSRYYHQQGVLSLSPSISLSGANVSLSNDYQMELMLPNPYLNVKAK
ncbi:hypothetical protein [[Clostridium] polysaccharolyticum]|uniref:Uncharacterized protein n=1 Tax=[Clostridium] polysaccharolyticum TaxID=29364 RepID=A0A1I0EXA4_9FIRM|nr:hypothetical protein [[Clostridium] polysaccharolyticum]SET50288.1 hypothetical protein SAMN04487772_12619 [[Clostridium] polysaccharolyticum]